MPERNGGIKHCGKKGFEFKKTISRLLWHRGGSRVQVCLSFTVCSKFRCLYFVAAGDFVGIPSKRA